MYMTKVRDTKNKKLVPVWDKINRIKSDLKELIPEVEDNRLPSIMNHIKTFIYGKNKGFVLTKTERLVMDYLLKNNLNPSTTARWLYACALPSDVEDKLRKGQVSFRRAVLIADNRKQAKLSNTGLLMVEEICNQVRSL